MKTDLLRKVNYIEKRAMISVGINKQPRQIPEYLKEFVLCTKYDHWSYEQEFRYFVTLKDAVEGGGRKLFYPFGDTLKLAEVILGHNARSHSIVCDDV